MSLKLSGLKFLLSFYYRKNFATIKITLKISDKKSNTSTVLHKSSALPLEAKAMGIVVSRLSKGLGHGPVVGEGSSLPWTGSAGNGAL